MNTKRVQLLMTVASLAALGCPVVTAATPPPATTMIRWDFPANTTPAAAQPPGCPAVATINPGAFGSGWLAQASLFGDASGLWDLGRQGTINLGGFDACLGDPNTERTFKVRVVCFQDGVFYSGPGQVAVPGAQLVGSATTTVATAGEGAVSENRWVETVTEWKVPAGSPAPPVIYTAEYDGSVVDSIAVETASVPAPPLWLSIQPVPGEPGLVELTWPATGTPVVLEANADLGDPAAWSAVELTPVVNNGVNTVQVPVSDGQQYFRLRQ